MNYLAHFYLSFPNDKLVVGNFIADDVKGNKFQTFEYGIARGIQMHRFIDHYTDTHPICLEAKKVLYPHFHKYAGVVLDVYFDHFLAKNWIQYSTIPLEEFCKQTELILEKHKDLFSEKMLNIFFGMKHHQWLLRYSSLTGIEKTLQGMSKRALYLSGMECGGEVLVSNYDFLEQTFNHFFSTLKLTVEQTNFLK